MSIGQPKKYGSDPSKSVPKHIVLIYEHLMNIKWRVCNFMENSKYACSENDISSKLKKKFWNWSNILVENV